MKTVNDNDQYIVEDSVYTSIDNVSDTDTVDIPEGHEEFSIENVMAELTSDIEDTMFNPDNSIITDVKKRKRIKKSQSEIDQELVKTFTDNPTHENFNKLWERFYYGVKSYAYKFLHNTEMADEIACVTFTRGWEYRDMYDPEKSNFSTWLYTICKNLCLAELYKQKKDNYFPQDISEIYDSEKLSNNIVTVSDKNQYTVEDNNLVCNTPDEITQKIYNTSIIEINNLGGNYTKVLTMKLVDDKKIREISDELDMNESTVKNYLYKGKEMLNDILKTKYHTLYEMYIDICSSNDAEAV